jgi:putative aldouronate transport system permease protein
MKKSKGEIIFDVINSAFMIIMILVCAYPLLYVILSSFSDPTELMSHRGIMVKPVGFTLKGYELVLKNKNISSGYFNTIIYVFAGTLVNLFFTSLSAYVLSRRNLYWGKALMFMVTFTMFFGGGLIPFYLLIRDLNLIDNRLVMIIPGAISVWNLIVMRTSFMEIPASLEESAKIDGANDFVVLFKIVLPLSKSVMAVMALFYAVGHWNSWFNAMIFLRKRSLYPLQLILREILIQNDVSTMRDIVRLEDMQNQDKYRALVQYCTIIVATVPILLIYPFLQKYFVKGVMIGSIKG